MNHTPNYDLSQWSADDRILMDDFNTDNAKIDGALAEEKAAREAAVTAINAALSGAVKLAAGTYTGDGAASRTISLGFTPRAVFVCNQPGYTYYDTGSRGSVHGGLAVTGCPVNNSDMPALAIADGGFKVAFQSWSNFGICTNVKDTKYNYIALG